MYYLQELQRNLDTRDKWIEYSAFDAEATWHVRKELEALLKEMYWSDEKVNGEFVERSMWDFYNRYYCDFGQLLVNMEDRGIHVFFYYSFQKQIDVNGHLPEVEKEARKELEVAKSQFLSWAVKEGGEELQYMNINSSAQRQQLLFAPSLIF